MDLLKSGNQHAFAEIYERYFGPLYLHAYKRIRDKDEARDLVQELFSHLWSKRDTLEPRTSFSNYLYTWVRNSILNIIAHKAVEEKYLSSLPGWTNDAESLTDHRVRERQLAAIIEKEIDALPPRMRAVFELSRKSNMSYKEIAEKLDLTEQSVRSHVKNALKILRMKLGVLVYLFYIFYK
ncbi:RNA polymerase sigma-70 factor [Chitinophaga oryziterrae]|uniref:RNA polymerase sigma-70 factor n=2 Tax=Chitinophaga oryziterrae TaxID=1031224 RepID=A0A6N8J3B2_9BACT|nr:RNA polymerase sigma-70 factor [Chitinophaga oryziterrae]MVT39513.1 RNA polymerase sigma-70 factor [Chitinophaga oryziterrae]